MGILHWLVLGVLLVGLIALPVIQPWYLIGYAVLAMLVIAGQIEIGRRQRKLALSRPNGSICSFARSLSPRSTDTWLIRATYEELQDILKYKGKELSITASDRLVEDLQIDVEDLEDTIKDIGQRAGYDLSNTESNPMYGKISTIEDLVTFFVHQPRATPNQAL